MTWMGLEHDVIDREAYRRTVGWFRGAGIVLPTFAQLADPATLPAARRESRGAHACSDNPKRDDQNFLHHSLVFFAPAGPRVAKKPVTITRFQPEERKY